MSDSHGCLKFWRYLRAAMIYVIAIGIFVPHFSASAQAQNNAQNQAPQETYNNSEFADFLNFNEEIDLILIVRRGARRLLANDLLGLEKDGEQYIPVKELADKLEFPATLDLEKGTVEGWYIKSGNKFKIDAINRTIQRGETIIKFSDEDFLLKDHGYGIGDIYLNTATLNKLWPLDFRLDYSGLSLWIDTPQRLPYEMRAALQSRHDRFSQKQSEKQADADMRAQLETQLKPIDNSYKMLSKPRLGLSNSWQWRNQERLITNETTVIGQNDFLGMEADYQARFNYDNDTKRTEIENTRFRLTRRAYEKDDLPFGLQFLQLGDIGFSGDTRIGESVSGRGFTISNSPLIRSNKFDEITVEGFAEAGWDIELYVNNILTEVSTVPDNGEYRFDNVPLKFGPNEVKVILYGPIGQVEERIENHDVVGARIPKGETYLSASFIDVEKQVIPLQSENTDPDKGKKAYKITAQRGLNKLLTGQVSFFDMPTETEDKQYISGGVSFNAFNGGGQIDLYKELGGGSVLDTSFSRNLFGFSLSLNNAWFYDFESRQAGKDGVRKTYESQLNVSRSFATKAGTLNMKLSGSHQERENNGRSSQINFSNNFSGHKYKIDNITRAAITNDNLTSVTGALGTNFKLGDNISVRGSTFYQMQPHFDFNTFQGQISHRGGLKGHLNSSINITQNLQAKGTAVGIGLGYEFEKFLGNLNLNWTRGSGVNVTLRASTSLAPLGRNGKYIMDSKSLLSASAINSQIFLDQDGDGLYGPDDLPVPDVKIAVHNRFTAPSDENGMIRQTIPAQHVPSNIMLSDTKLENPFLKSDFPGYRATLRPGTQLTVDFPVVETGAIDGFVMFANGRTVPGIILQLIDQEGRIIGETRSMYDGFFQFQYVFPGTYTVQTSPQQKQIFTEPQPVAVTSDEPFVFGIELIIKERSKEGSTKKAELDGAQNGRIAQNSTMNAASAADLVKHIAPAAAARPVSAELGTYMTEPDLAVMYSPAVNINRIRTGKHPGKLRLVLDLSAAAAYRINIIDDGQAVTIDMPNATWNVERAMPDVTGSILQEISSEILADGAVRLKLRAKDGMRILDEGFISSNSGSGMRLYIDLGHAQ